jgi:hypothetical protein
LTIDETHVEAARNVLLVRVDHWLVEAGEVDRLVLEAAVDGLKGKLDKSVWE